MNLAFADLHTHTYFSDGVIGPEELVRRAQACPDLECFALTDHDSLSGIEPVYRFREALRADSETPPKGFIPGVELSLRVEDADLTVHLIGLFVHIHQGNYRHALGRVEEVLGAFCRERSFQRGLKDMDARIHKAFALNLDGLGVSYRSAEQVISILRQKAEASNRLRFTETGKEDDLIQHPIPVTYQVIIDHWEELLPESSKERITLYTLRPSPSHQENLSRIYASEGMAEAEARERAVRLQGVLSKFDAPVLRDRGILEGLRLLHEARAVSILAHPAVDHHRISYEDFDRHVLLPLVQGGLHGIEVFYPYDPSFRQEAFSHYLGMAAKHDLLISGGTDYHGDGRVELSDVKLGMDETLRILQKAPGAVPLKRL